jgi:hypothetical protein
MTVDYPGRRLRFAHDTLPTPNATDVLPLTRAGDFWALPITMAGKHFAAVLDTRSTGSFSVTPSVADELPFDGPLEVVGRASGVAIPVTEVKRGRLAGDVTIGQYTFPHRRLTCGLFHQGFPPDRSRDRESCRISASHSISVRPGSA